MEDIIEIVITRRDVLESTKYLDNTGCPLAVAAKRRFPDFGISVTPGCVRLWPSGEAYSMEGAEDKELVYKYDSEWDMDASFVREHGIMQVFINGVQESKSMPSIPVTLRRFN